MKNTLLASLLLLISACAMAPDESGTDSGKKNIVGIKNFSRLTDAPGFAGSPVGFGGATEPSAMPLLKAEGFATVISLRLSGEEGAHNEANRAAAEAAGLNYIHLPFDSGTATVADVEAVLSALGERGNQPVYLHCGSATRAAMLFMIGRVQKDGWDLEAASEEARTIAEKPAQAIAFSSGYLAAQRKP